MRTFLREERLVKNYETTSGLEILKPCSYRNGSTKFHLKKGIDLNGDKIYTKYWESLIKDSNYSIFIFDTYKIINNDKETINYITENLPIAVSLAKKYKRKLFVFGNFTDKIYNFDIKRLEIKNKLRPNIINAIDDAKIKFSSIMFGSMNTKGNIRESLDVIYATILKYKKKKLLRKVIIISLVILILALLFAMEYYKMK